MRLTRLARLVIGTSVLACCAAIPAAASASVQISAGADGGDYIISVIGDEGSQNLDVTSTPTNISFASGNAEAMTAGTGCSGTGPVTCTIPSGDWSVVFTEVSLSGSGDTFNASALAADAGLLVEGGDGNDNLTGSNFGDYIVGDDGVDQFSGLGGDDIVDIKDEVEDSATGDCGSGNNDLLIFDYAELFTIWSGCEAFSPVIQPLGITGTPRVGNTVSISGGGFYGSSGSATAVPSRQWFTCATADQQGCGAPTTSSSYSPSATEVGRFLFARASASLVEFPFLGALDIRDSAPVQIIAARTTSTPAPRPPALVIGAFKSGRTGFLAVTSYYQSRITVGPAATGTAAAKRKKKPLVATTSKLVPARSTVQIPVRLTSEGKKRLQKRGKLKVKLLIASRPGDAPLTMKPAFSATTTVTFKATKKKEKK